MGSFRHPKLYDQVTLQSVRDTFYDILEEMDEQVSTPVNPHRLKADIVQRLLDLASNGTPQEEWKAKVLSTLSLR
jgi:hypothetical protein